jgi:hypothetical protein
MEVIEGYIGESHYTLQIGSDVPKDAVEMLRASIKALSLAYPALDIDVMIEGGVPDTYSPDKGLI